MTDVADVVIVGGGVAGASLAYVLAREGLGVTVVEGAAPIASATTSCSAFASFLRATQVE